MAELNWDERDLDDFDAEEIIASKPKQIFRRNNDSSDTQYPFDFWYRISMYIPPEDIGRFALICRTTNQIVNTKHFWIRLFTRYNKHVGKNLIRLLRQEHMSVIRTYVVRFLYTNYPIFQNRFDKTVVIQKEPHFLISSRCIRIWYSKASIQHEIYNYYFEFRFDSDYNSNDQQIQSFSPLFDINNQYIIDKNTWILQIRSSNFVPIGPYMGMILTKLTLNVSNDYRYHKLKMWFDSSKLSLQKSLYNNPVVIIDPIRCLRIYTWYNSPVNFD